MSNAIEHLATLTVHRDRDLLDTTLVRSLRELFNPSVVAVHMLVGPPGEPQRWLLRARLEAQDVAPTSDPCWVRLDELPLRESKPLHARCIETQQILRVDHDGARGNGGGCTVLFPMAMHGEQATVLELQSAGPFPEEMQHTADGVLRVYRNFCGLLDYSERDTLTGLLNRKTFDEAFYKTVQASAAQTLPALGRRQAMPAPAGGTGHWLGVLDIDHFKRVNDTYGHLIGDEVLLLVGRIMRSSFRFQDRLYRFGGEEFVVLVRCPAEAGAACAFERVRRNMERYAFPRVGSVTVSIGFTEVLPGDTPTAAFERADKAVYYAKQNGRNQVRSHGALVAAGLLDAARADNEVELF